MWRPIRSSWQQPRRKQKYPSAVLPRAICLACRCVAVDRLMPACVCKFIYACIDRCMCVYIYIYTGCVYIYDLYTYGPIEAPIACLYHCRHTHRHTPEYTYSLQHSRTYIHTYTCIRFCLPLHATCHSLTHPHRLSVSSGRRTRVIGWYHSHPHITVLPSHVGEGRRGGVLGAEGL